MKIGKKSCFAQRGSAAYFADIQLMVRLNSNYSREWKQRDVNFPNGMEHFTGSML